ncbi:MAG: hypothetical protein JOY78_02620 [Pseudonocardia sp.]|nr:hypothetical protein [Pseudonocardia sp.]
MLNSGWSRPRELVVDDVPHTWLFLRMAGVVHHGGAGQSRRRCVRARP